MTNQKVIKLLDKRLFKKGQNHNFHLKYIVEKVHGKTVQFTNGFIKKRDMLLKVHTDTIRSKKKCYTH